jgi:hypothetical protein
MRRLCIAAALVGAAGLTVAWIGSAMGPVALIVQGQSWRWVWISVFVSLLVLPGTALHVWRDDNGGPLLTVLLILGWTLPPEVGIVCVSLALALWVMRSQFDGRVYFRWAAVALGIAIGVWIVAKSAAILSHGSAAAASGSAEQIREIFQLQVPAALFATLAWWCIRISRTTSWVASVIGVLLATLSIFLWPAAFKQSHTYASAADVNEFRDWSAAIPPTSTVLVTPARDVGAFVWFTLGRPNYLAVDQSAGVVFSRATAMEVKRRSGILLPLMDPNWKIMTGLRAAASGRKVDITARPLNADILRRVCADPKLGFVISPAAVGIGGIRHDQTGAWKDWNLYDCGQVRPDRPSR